MKQYLELIGSVLKEAMKPRFQTTLDAVQRVMGVPMVAVQAIARNAGIDNEMQVGACIDENALTYFADAYVRNVKSYYKKTRAVYNQLGADEQIAFCHFCREFNKIDLPFPEASSWNDIDEDAIREQFYHDVKKLSPKEVSPLGTFFEHISFDIQDNELKSVIDPFAEKQAEYRTMIMRKVTRCYLFNAKLKKSKRIQIDNAIIHLMQVIAHYHIYISSDEDNHPMSIVTFKRNDAVNLMYNNALKMAA